MNIYTAGEKNKLKLYCIKMYNVSKPFLETKVENMCYQFCSLKMCKRILFTDLRRSSKITKTSMQVMQMKLMIMFRSRARERNGILKEHTKGFIWIYTLTSLKNNNKKAPKPKKSTKRYNVEIC